MRFLTGLLLLTMVVASPVLAQERLPSGVTALNLSVTETQKVKQDTIVSSMRFEAKGTKAAEVQDKINRAVKKALDIIKSNKDVTVTTESYQVYMNQQIEMRGNKEVRREEWSGSQSLVMTSKTMDSIQKLTGELQADGFASSGFGYTLSPEKAETVRQTLLKGTMDKIKTQASSAAELLGKKGYDVREVTIDGGYYPQPMMMRSMAMDMAAGKAEAIQTPNAESGEQDVSMTVNARVELK